MTFCLFTFDKLSCQPRKGNVIQYGGIILCEMWEKGPYAVCEQIRDR